MTLWTIQSIEAWQVLKASRILSCNNQLIEKEFFEAYVWMAKQMEKRIPVPRPGNAMPLWAWYQWDGERRKRPDLRSSGHLPRGERGVRIEFQIRDDWVFYRILISGIMCSITGIYRNRWLMRNCLK